MTIDDGNLGVLLAFSFVIAELSYVTIRKSEVHHYLQ